MKKTIKKIVVFSALLTLLGSPAVFAAEEGTQSQTKEQKQEGTQTQTKEQKQEGTQSQTKTNTSSQACDNN